jgi:hypothetical protein
MVAYIQNSYFLPKGSVMITPLLYHTWPPTQIIHTDEPVNVMPKVAEEKMLKHRSFEGFHIKPQKDFLQSRKPVLGKQRLPYCIGRTAGKHA